VLAIVKGAEMLELIDTPQRLVRLTPVGQRFVRADMDERRQIWRNQAAKLALFRLLREHFEDHRGELDREQVVALIRQRVPREDPARTFETMVNWGRFGGLLGYDEEARVVTAA